MKVVHIVAAFVIAAASNGIQAQNLLTNGNFQDAGSSATPFIPNGETSAAFASIYAGSNLPGWTVTFGSVDVVYSYWSNPAGSNSLHLSGNYIGGIAQTFATAVGQKYHVSFDLAGNPNGGSPVKTVMVSLASNPFFQFDTAGKSSTNMGWVTKGFDYTANDTQTTLAFTGLETFAYGPVIANVSVMAVPEPETYAMLLAGLGLIGAAVKRRKLMQA